MHRIDLPHRFPLSIRQAFTSVEVLAATALAAGLMVAVLGVLAGIAKKERLLEKSAHTPVWHDHLARQLQADLRAARSFRHTPEGLILSGHGGTDGPAEDPTWLPTDVHFYQVETRGQSLLVRQAVATYRVATGPPPQLMVYGGGRLELFPASIGETGQTLEGALQTEPLPDGLLPSRVRAVVFSGSELTESEEVKIVFERSFFLY